MRTRKRPVGVLLAVCVGVLVAVATAAVAGAEVSRSATDTSATREPVDLFYLSDSSGWGVAELDGRHIKKALGVAVRVHDSTSRSLGRHDPEAATRWLRADAHSARP